MWCRITTIPTVGFNVETVTYKNVRFNVWVDRLSVEEGLTWIGCRRTGQNSSTMEALLYWLRGIDFRGGFSRSRPDR